MEVRASAYLAPRIGVFCRRITMSMRMYKAAGIVANAVSPCHHLFARHCSSENLRPANIARVVKLPCSASNRSSKGVNAKVLNSAWKNPRCMNGKVFNRYTEHIARSALLCFRSGHGGHAYLSEAQFLSVLMNPIARRSIPSVTPLSRVRI
jgi:hypothetical protein